MGFKVGDVTQREFLIIYLFQNHTDCGLENALAQRLGE